MESGIVRVIVAIFWPGREPSVSIVAIWPDHEQGPLRARRNRYCANSMLNAKLRKSCALNFVGPFRM